MINYYFTEIKSSVNDSVNTLLDLMCKENNIHKERQGYKIYFSKETIFKKDNNLLFTSGSKKYLSFYGKIYLNTYNKIVETVYLDNENIVIYPSTNSILIMCGGIPHSTVVQAQEDVLYFYIAPSLMLDLHEPGKWEDI